MSKSLGNFYTIREIVADFDTVALRHYFLSSHYRSPMDFSLDGLTEAARATDRIYETLERIDRSMRESAAPDHQNQTAPFFKSKPTMPTRQCRSSRA